MKKLKVKKIGENRNFQKLLFASVAFLGMTALVFSVDLVQKNQNNETMALSDWGKPYTTNSGKCRDAGGVCATFSKKLGDGDTCNVVGYNEIRGLVKVGLCGGSTYTVCCTGLLSDTVITTDSKNSGEIVQDEECTKISGKCQKKTDDCKNGRYYNGYCPSSDSADVMCCVSKTRTTIQDEACSKQSGHCISTNGVCDGEFVTGLCPSSGNNIKCCVPKVKVEAAKKVSVKQDKECTDRGGVCQSVKGGCSNGYFRSGLCPSSGSDIKCCVQYGVGR